MTIKEFIDSIPAERRAVFIRLREAIMENLPEGFQESVSPAMLNYAVPHSIYPKGYHCNPSQPLPFISIAPQKNAITLHHMGLYADPVMLNWFTTEYAKQVPTKPDMGKGCVRFKKMGQIPFQLIAELTSKISVHEWIAIYESRIRR